MIDPALVDAAAERLRGVAVRTPLVHSAPLSEAVGSDVWLKLETEQRTGSFKLRGAFNALAALDPEVRARGVVASSAGNHGLGLAWAGRELGVPVTVFVPMTAPAVKREGIAALGAAVDASSADYDAAHDAAVAFARARGATFVNPCAGDTVLAGQGTIALEILEELPAVATVVLSVGGGGLLGGIASVLRARARRVRIVGAQSIETAAMARSLAAGRVVEVPVTPTLADGLAGQVDAAGLAIARGGLDALLTVSEAELARAIGWLAARAGVTAEGSAAAPVAALLGGHAGPVAGPVAVVVSGRNIDAARHHQLVAAYAG